MHTRSPAFLEDFPSLREWLTLNGFWAVHATTDFRTRTHISMWTDQCRDEDGAPRPSASDTFLAITHCEECKTVEVYVREFIGRIVPDEPPHFSMKLLDRNTVTDTIERIVRG